MLGGNLGSLLYGDVSVMEEGPIFEVKGPQIYLYIIFLSIENLTNGAG